MRRFLLSLCGAILLSSAFVSAENLTVRVGSKGEPLPFSYVFVNGRPFSSTNGQGITYILKEGLNEGDSISASYVGMKPGYVIYKKTAAGNTLNIDLKADALLDKVTVTYEPWDLYWKYVKNWKVDQDYLNYTAHIAIKWGPLYLKGRLSSVMHRLMCLEIEEEQLAQLDSTTVEFIKHTVLQHVDRVYCNSYRIYYAGNEMLQHINTAEREKYIKLAGIDRYKLSYHGEMDGRRVFVQVWPESHNRALFVNKRRKSIERIYSNITYGGDWNRRDMMDVTYRVTSRTMLAPKSIDANLIVDGKVAVILHLSDIRYAYPHEVQGTIDVKDNIIWISGGRNVVKHGCMIDQYLRTKEFF